MHDVTAMARFFKALSDPTRLRIVRLMAFNDEELCVCELVDSLEEAQYHISRHLRELRDAGLLAAERDGRWVYYALTRKDPVVKRFAKLVAALPEDDFAADQMNFLRRMELRVDGRCQVGIQKAELADDSGSKQPQKKPVGRNRKRLMKKRPTARAL